MKRRFYSDCQIAVEAWGDQEAFNCDDAEVWIEGESILVSYFDDEGVVVLEGRSDGAGGWNLAARSRPRRATLSPEPTGAGSDHAEERRDYTGTIDEQGEKGRWTLQLGDLATQD